MKYRQTVPGIFIKRPNRFIAYVQINGQEEICHVKNTGRCQELLVPGRTVYCAVSDNPHRKTKYDVVATEKITTKGTLLINMDSQAPNAAVKEWLLSDNSPFGNITYMKPEYTYGTSRFDFYLECGRRKIFIEVKGVTLENSGVALFPDAPTERGLKHIRELIHCHREGFETCILFVIQMENANYFTPNRKTHPQFADALREAKDAGVQLAAFTCKVTPAGMKIDKPAEIYL